MWMHKELVDKPASHRECAGVLDFTLVLERRNGLLALARLAKRKSKSLSLLVPVANLKIRGNVACESLGILMIRLCFVVGKADEEGKLLAEGRNVIGGRGKERDEKTLDAAALGDPKEERHPALDVESGREHPVGRMSDFIGVAGDDRPVVLDRKERHHIAIALEPREEAEHDHEEKRGLEAGKTERANDEWSVGREHDLHEQSVAYAGARRDKGHAEKSRAHHAFGKALGRKEGEQRRLER